jgi:recombination DNA repair RAD52 pathway protein
MAYRRDEIGLRFDQVAGPAVGRRRSISRLLARPLGPEFISTRRGSGGVSFEYLIGHYLIRLANAVFGYNG